MRHDTHHGQAARCRAGRVAVVLVALVALAALLGGCSSSAGDTESAMPTNVLPDEGSPVVYEFYTDT